MNKTFVMKLKSSLFFLIKKIGLINKYIIVNLWIKRRLGIKQKEFESLYTFYGQLIGNGSLVFDIGANIGNRTEVFLALGAKVICIEPNKKLIPVLKNRFGRNVNCQIINAGCGSEQGQIEFQISENSLLSTFSKQFIQHKEKLGNLANKWINKDIVQVVPLDSIIAQFGNYDFCKIDVEGYELEVIKGLNKKAGLVSLEFTSPTFNNDTIECIKKLHSLGYEFYNLSFGETLQFEFDEWIQWEDLIRYISIDPKMKNVSYGDIYAK
jgi:FkbM family methyltransferase